ncbi:Rrf2 family transcriptional regulator [Oceanobacillus profundus]|jgi:Rrf2 family nitric oxide-sensitive transcriptional repressor|uniref:HTH-type transcriptional regulator NsrR n=1 Tax=Oceanobacillus profundus TaxID=372463 RepID=A0A417YH36_9BACI|nr:Rrf2 family transcriptional regulator [Oceanobacillus profundus]MCM3398046.1 Rrf2 family transcriptional regulator [Oceanobacillus profundus]MDO6451281.1 Rrf2 family transcriptional regulator [Oceanobacillus profundus]PAE27319.1 Rrf2 family transcriptional regulator [Paenibacillus sp. 7884-2]RHW32212.1 Rrf2 family transcriptional regulator [Oceanobacillus profundus]
MQLKKYTDYALRVLIYTGTKPNDELASIKEISEVFNISQHHLGKIVFELNKMGLLETIRGRNGGIRLAKPASEINVGLLVRSLESDFNLLECFDKGTNHCVITPACTLKHALNKALHAFFKVLDEYTVQDLISNEEELRALMGMDR